jgi:hypothetical protein
MFVLTGGLEPVQILINKCSVMLNWNLDQSLSIATDIQRSIYCSAPNCYIQCFTYVGLEIF